MAKVKEFLELCGYTDEEEIKRTIPRLEESMRRAKMEPGDVEHAIDSMHKCYRSDLELESVRKMLGVWLKKWMALMHARDEYKKVVYHFHPGQPRAMLMLNLVSDDIYCDFADMLFYTIAGRIFNNNNRYLEMGEKAGLPPARAHCGASLIGLAIQAEGLLQPPDLIVNSVYQCDQQHKVAEMIAELWGVPQVKADTVADEAWGLFPDISDRAVKYWGATMEAELIKKTEEILGIEISDEVIQKSRHIYARMWRLLDEIHHVIADAERRPVNFGSFFIFDFAVLEPDRIIVNEGIPILELHLKELKERVERGYGVLPKGAPRIVLKCEMGGDMTCAPLPEDVGLNVVVPINATWLAEFEKHPVIDYARFKGASPTEKVAAAFLRKGYIRACDHHVWRVRELVRETNADGLIFDPVYQCRAFAGLPVMVKQTVEKDLGVPTMYLEVGAFDARDHNYDTMKTRMETFAELLKARKAMAEETK